MMIEATKSAPARSFYGPLQPLCTASLAKSLNPDTHLFDRQLRHGTWQPTLGTEGLTSTCIALIGVHRAEIEPVDLRLDPARSLDALCRQARRQRYPGATGLVLWAHAVWDALSAPLVCQRIGYPLASLPGIVERLTTMELAWLVSGLVHQGLRGRADQIAPLLDRAVDQLIDRFSETTHLMRHATRRALPVHRLRRQIANFADQIYPVQALAFVAIERDDDRARKVLGRLAERLVSLQGPAGQWWWQYNANSGQVAQYLPVYSVHQHGMAPMALLAAETACGTSFDQAVERSQQWLSQNEMNRPLVDSQVQTIWRDIQWAEGRMKRTFRNLRVVTGQEPQRPPTDPERLEINYETRPYEWGWCLYAAAVAERSVVAGHVA
jgi:hypothetical protein